MNTQPTDNGLWDNPRKRADELKAGDHIIDRPGTPLEVTHTQARAADGLILVVFADGVARPYNPDAPFTMATEEQLAADRNRQAWRQVVDQVHAWLSWIGKNADELPAPTSMELRMQHSMGWPADDAQKRATAASVAGKLGADLEERSGPGTGVVTAAFEVADRSGGLAHELRYVVHGFVTPLPTVEPVDDEPVRGTENGDPDAVLPPTVEGHAHQRGQDWRDDEPAELPHLVEPAPQVDPALADEAPKPGYDPNPTILLAKGQTYQQWYEKYAASLDTSNPGWWNDDVDRMAGTLADLARERRAETWGENELDHDRIPTAEGFEAHEAAKDGAR
jgi:hypothetical protein